MQPLPHIDAVLSNCIHCGMCLPVCPTYALTNDEQSSPRGRIRLMRELHAGNLELGEVMVDEMYFCLDCQACETACPAGVLYGELVEDARRIIAEKKKEPFALRFIKSLILKGVLSSNARTKFVARILRLYEKSGLREAVDSSGILKLFSPALHTKHAMLPGISRTFFDDSRPAVIPHLGELRGKVAFLTGCIMNVSFADIHDDVVTVLTLQGYDVMIPKDQNCCGSLLAHYGGIEDAKELARKNIEAFEKTNPDTVIVDSAGCGAFMKEYGKVLQDDPEYSVRASAISKKTKDILEFLSESARDIPLRSLDSKVTYHEACHLVHTQKISRQPRDIIQSIPGITFKELPEATWCCGSAGIYNILRFDDSVQLLHRKMENIRSTGADIVLTANPGCHLQLQYGIKKSELNMKVMHPVSLLRRAYDV